MAAALIFAIILPLALALGYAARSRGDRMVADWAAENQLKLLDVKPYRSPFKSFYGPKSASNVQSLYRVTARDEGGHIVEGWLKCGGWLIGLFADKVEFTPERKSVGTIDPG